MVQIEIFNTRARAKPFLKWAGGKSSLVRQLQHFYPEELKQGKIDRYIEPFLGSGAVFYDVIQKYDIEEAFLGDINPDLILTYKVLKHEPDALIRTLGEIQDKYHSLNSIEQEKFYYFARDRFNQECSEITYQEYSDQWISHASNLIFLNKTCYNGLYRVNRKGEFNVAFGKYENPALFEEENLLRSSELLHKANLHIWSYEKCEPYVNKNTFVYFDPPYWPLSSTSNFTSYSKDPFKDENQKELVRFFSKLDKQCNAKLMLSNSDPSVTNLENTSLDELYSQFTVHKVYANRSINSNPNKRNKISEIIVMNY